MTGIVSMIMGPGDKLDQKMDALGAAFKARYQLKQEEPNPYVLLSGNGALNLMKDQTVRDHLAEALQKFADINLATTKPPQIARALEEYAITEVVGRSAFDWAQKWDAQTGADDMLKEILRKVRDRLPSNIPVPLPKEDMRSELTI